MLVAPPPGAAYNFIVNLYTYPGAWINTCVTCGLIYLQWNKKENWSSPWHTYLPISIIYLLLNLFLAITPFIPPNNDWNADGYPYYAFPLVGTGVLVLGGVYWALWTKVWPKIGGYIVVAERIIDEDTGEEVVRYNKVNVKKLESEVTEVVEEVGVQTPLLPRQGVASGSGHGGGEEAVYQTFGLDGR